MVAINLTLLGKQLEQLRSQFDDPVEFRSSLHRFFGFYHQYAHRRHRDTISESFMQHYDLPVQIVPQLELSLRKRITEDIQQSYALVDELWKDDYFEARDLACFILGQLPAEESENVMAQVKKWLETPLDRAVLASVFEHACKGVLDHFPALFSDLVKSLLENPEIRKKRQGLYALGIYLTRAHINELPMVYSMIRPFISHSELQLQGRLAELVHTLAQKSPGEVVYLLKEVLSDTQGPEIEQRLRSYLPFFEPDYAQSIQQAIKNHAAQRKQFEKRN